LTSSVGYRERRQFVIQRGDRNVSPQILQHTSREAIMEMMVGDMGVSIETSRETGLVPFINTIAEYLDLGDRKIVSDIELMKILRHQMLFTEIASPKHDQIIS
jgi:hypothetical protein